MLAYSVSWGSCVHVPLVTYCSVRVSMESHVTKKRNTVSSQVFWKWAFTLETKKWWSLSGAFQETTFHNNWEFWVVFIVFKGSCLATLLPTKTPKCEKNQPFFASSVNAAYEEFTEICRFGHISCRVKEFISNWRLCLIMILGEKWMDCCFLPEENLKWYWVIPKIFHILVSMMWDLGPCL